MSIISAAFLFQLKFTFRLDQFFPEGDEDLEFYLEFIEEFETDINFLLVAVESKNGVFQQEFLESFNDFTIKARSLPHIKNSQSLTQFSYPVKTPFGITTIPAIHIDQPIKYEKDSIRLLADPRFAGNLIAKDGKSLVVALKTIDQMGLEESAELISALHQLIADYNFDDSHILGPAYFQKEMVDMQKREITFSAIVSALLVSLVMFGLFRRPWGIFISLISIGLGLLLFMGLLSLVGRELNAMSALYPVLMIIVGTSDVIHITSKYIDELRKGKTKEDAIWITIKEIGLATLLTSLTTAIGFATLLTSRLSPIKDFGINAAAGVIVAYITVIFFTTALLSYFDKEKIIKLGRGQRFWDDLMSKAYKFTLNHPRGITIGAALTFILCAVGISMISTNFRLESNLPRNSKITDDFIFFENTFAGFRPIEFAVFAKEPYEADDYAVLKEVDKVEKKLMENPALGAINSTTTIYKSINQMNKRNRLDAYKMPPDEKTFNRYKRMVDKIPEATGAVMLSKDKSKARITSRVLDVGADSIQYLADELDAWILANTDEDVASFKITGTGLILDKNAQYVRKNLLQGLGVAILIISLLMALLFQDLRMLAVSIVPNIFPLLLAGALLGFFGIELEAGTAIVFAVVFGIAVDDTIHFLSKFKLSRDKGLGIEEALQVTFMETGKAICLTTVILFFGFLVMLFSIHPPSVIVGSLISLTLLSALLSDLLLIPLLIRWLIKP